MTPGNAEQRRISIMRIRQVFEYLKVLNEHRNPAVRQIKEQPWFMWLDDLPNHPAVELAHYVLEPANPGNEVAVSQADACRFKVRRPGLTAPPPPPEEIRDWLQAGWDDPDREVQCTASRNHIDRDGKTVTIHFSEDPGRLTALNVWKNTRDKWREAERPARLAMSVFEKLYALHGRLQRESERFELVIGDGLLSWQQNDGDIYHPLLLQRVQLEFDPRTPEFKVMDADARVELYTSLFHTIAGVDARMLAVRRQELEAGSYHPLSKEVQEILRWADAYREASGKWPTIDAGDIPGSIGESWRKVDSALRAGGRGLPASGSLAQFLAEQRGARYALSLPPLAEQQILDWADAYHRQTGHWPNRASGIIAQSGGETWAAVHQALCAGRRGLPGGSSLAQFLAKHRGVRNIKGLGDLTYEQILVWADAYFQRHGKWPAALSGPIVEAPGETWAGVASALDRGRRALPGGTTLPLLLAEYRGVRNTWTRANLSYQHILAWADAFHERTDKWPTLGREQFSRRPARPGVPWITP